MELTIYSFYCRTESEEVLIVAGTNGEDHRSFGPKWPVAALERRRYANGHNTYPARVAPGHSQEFSFCKIRNN
jgi:hypothetical protein